MLASLHDLALLMGTELFLPIGFFISKLANGAMPTLALEVALNDRMIVTQATFSTETFLFGKVKKKKNRHATLQILEISSVTLTTATVSLLWHGRHCLLKLI